MHRDLSTHTKALKKVSLRKWIGVLAHNRLKNVSPQDYKCIYEARQSRVIALPPFADTVMPLADCLLMIE